MGDRASFEAVEKAISEIAQGRLVILGLDERWGHGGDLAMAAQFATEKDVAFMMTHGSLSFVAMTQERLSRLQLPQMVNDEKRPANAAAVTVTARETPTTGGGSSARTRTIHVLADPLSKPNDLVRPGSIFPVRAREGGVVERPGSAEAVVDLCRMAGINPVGLICRMTTRDKELAGPADIRQFAQRHDIHVLKIADLVAYRLAKEQLVTRVASAKLPTAYGSFLVHGYVAGFGDVGAEHIALTMGELGDPALTYVHSACLSGDVFRSEFCVCRERLGSALERIAKEGCGIVIYLRERLTDEHDIHEEQSSPRAALEGYANGPFGIPRVQNKRGLITQILRNLGVRRIRLLGNAGEDVLPLAGIEVVTTIPLRRAAS